MMFRTSLRLLTVLAVLGSLTLGINGASAQTTPNDLVPNVRSVARGAFRTASGGDTTMAGGQIAQTDPILSTAPFTDLMLRWQSDTVDSTVLQVEVRASADGRSWSPWGDVAISDDPVRADEPANTRWSDIIPADLSRYYQLRVTLLPDASGTLPTFDNFQVHTVDARITNEPAPQPTGGGDMSTQAVARPAYVSRVGWGSPDGEGSRATVARRAVTHLVVHHTADSDSLSSGEPNWAARVRAYWSFHAISRGWGDIGYNWLIDPNGVIYEGRSGSPDDTASGGAVGFHDTANYGSMGVSVIGTYGSKTPTAAAQNSLVNILAWKASARGINPTGASFYYGCSISNYCAPFNSGSVVPNIAGHRQVTPGHTTCPGDAFMGILGSIRDRVVQRINGVPEPTGDNGDSTIDDNETTFHSTGAGAFKIQTGCGVGGSTRWSYASSANDGVTNDVSGEWRPSLRQGGMYKVRLYVPQQCGLQGRPDYATTSATYTINYTNGGRSTAVVNQQTGAAYVEVGPFQFDAGTGGSVTLSDLTNDDFAAKQVVFFDAVEWVYQQPVIAARLVEAKVQSPVVVTGGLVQVQFKVKNVGTTAIDTQEPFGGLELGPISGWTYDESGCFQGSGTAFAKVGGRLRVTLGFDDGSTYVPTDCTPGVDPGGYQWRWGLRSALQPGETRTIVGYIRFRTPGTYYFDANLVNEYVGYYGTDGGGANIPLGPVTVKDLPYKVRLPRTSR